MFYVYNTDIALIQSTQLKNNFIGRVGRFVQWVKPLAVQGWCPEFDPWDTRHKVVFQPPHAPEGCVQLYNCVLYQVQVRTCDK